MGLFIVAARIAMHRRTRQPFEMQAMRGLSASDRLDQLKRANIIFRMAESGKNLVRTASFQRPVTSKCKTLWTLYSL
jgi:hypothetical protein